jgi:hypothetical protein
MSERRVMALPIIVLTTPASGSQSLARGCAQLAASIAAAALSWRFVEEPVRRGAAGRLWARLRSDGWRAIGRHGRGGHRGRGHGGAGRGRAGRGGPGRFGGPPVGSPAALAASPVSAADTSMGGSATAARPGVPLAPGSSTLPAGVASGPRLLTSCRSVVHIGDSTSDGLVLPAYQPDAALRIAAQYRRVGVTRFIPEVSAPGRSWKPGTASPTPTPSPSN